jgi:hypothetical protein
LAGAGRSRYRGTTGDDDCDGLGEKDGETSHTLTEQLEQSSILSQDLPGPPQPKTVLIDLGFRNVDAEVS